VKTAVNAAAITSVIGFLSLTLPALLYVSRPRIPPAAILLVAAPPSGRLIFPIAASTDRRLWARQPETVSQMIAREGDPV
jgi:hypothetical protein